MDSDEEEEVAVALPDDVCNGLRLMIRTWERLMAYQMVWPGSSSEEEEEEEGAG